MNITLTDTPSDPIKHRGGYGTLILHGNFNGVSATLEADYGTGTWITQKDLNGDPIIITNAGEYAESLNFLTAKCDLRLNVTGGAAPDLVYKVLTASISVTSVY